MAIRDYANRYPGKTLEEIIKLEDEAAQRRIQEEKDAKEREDKFLADLLAHKYYKINFNGKSFSYVEITKSDRHNGIQAVTVNTYADTKDAYVKIESERALNILWFKDKGVAGINKITKEQYNEAYAMVSKFNEILNTIR